MDTTPHMTWTCGARARRQPLCPRKTWLKTMLPLTMTRTMLQDARPTIGMLDSCLVVCSLEHGTKLLYALLKDYLGLAILIGVVRFCPATMSSYSYLLNE